MVDDVLIIKLLLMQYFSCFNLKGEEAKAQADFKKADEEALKAEKEKAQAEADKAAANQAKVKYLFTHNASCDM